MIVKYNQIRSLGSFFTQEYRLGLRSDLWVSNDLIDWKRGTIVSLCHTLELKPITFYYVRGDDTAYKYVAEREVAFDKCPSVWGWHNPENLTAAQVLERAENHYSYNGSKVLNPQSVRLLCRDEVGLRTTFIDFKFEGSPENAYLYGNNTTRSHFTSIPYGDLKPPRLHSFPECARYGYSKITGEKISPPAGYRLLPKGSTYESEDAPAIVYDSYKEEGDEHTCQSEVYQWSWQDWDDYYNQKHVDAIFVPINNKPKVVPFKKQEDLPDWPVYWIRVKNTPYYYLVQSVIFATAHQGFRTDQEYIKFRKAAQDYEIAPSIHGPWRPAGKIVNTIPLIYG